MKKILALLLTINLIATNLVVALGEESISVSNDKPKDYYISIENEVISFSSAQEAIDNANDGLENIYGISLLEFEFKRKMQGRKINEEYAKGTWNHIGEFGSVLAYGDPHGDKKSIGGTEQYRYLGYTAFGDEYSNTIFPDDRQKVTSFADRYDNGEWIKEPWNQWNREETRGIPKLHKYFDEQESFKNNLLANFKVGAVLHRIDMVTGEIDIDTGKPLAEEDKQRNIENFFKTNDWMDYVHILSPPSQGTWGMGRIWSRDKNGKLWYVTIALAPHSLTNKLRQVDVVENEDGTVEKVEFLQPNLYENKVIITEPNNTELIEWVIANKETIPFDNTITWANVEQLPAISSGKDKSNVIVDTNSSNIIYVRYRKKSIKANRTGDMVISQKNITKAFNLDDIGGKPSMRFRYNSAGRHRHKDGDGNTYYVNRSSPVDSSYEYFIEYVNQLDELEIGIDGDFAVRYNGANEKSGHASWNGGSNSITPNMFFVAWRGKDIPTIANYKHESNPLADLGVPIGKVPQVERNTEGGYQEDVDIELGKGSKGDYNTKFACSECGNSMSQKHRTNNVEYKSTLGVQTFIGAYGLGNIASSHSINSINAGGVTFNKAKGFSIPNNELIKFYPYVQMTYDLPATNADGSGINTQDINVLAAHESAIKPNDYVEVGWVNPRNESLNLNSTQWSTHGRSVSVWGSNSVLPGGAVYRLDTKGPKTKVVATTWQHYVDGNELGALTAGAGKYTLNNARNKNNSFKDQVKQTLDTLDVVQYVFNNPKGNTFSGIELTMKPGQDVYGNKTSQDSKYRLRRGTPANSYYANEADIDVISEQTINTYYKVKADINGDVSVLKSNNGSSWTYIQVLNKNQTVANITNLEAKALEDRTKLVSNVINALERGKGNDTSASNGPNWYNEAFDGICVLKTDNIMDIGFKMAPVKSNVLDVKLCPLKKSKSDAFMKFYVSQFRLNEKSYTRTGKGNGYLGTFNGVDISIPQMENMYKSKKFYIPNATVMDLY